jgi:hypothetical protein
MDGRILQAREGRRKSLGQGATMNKPQRIPIRVVAYDGHRANVHPRGIIEENTHFIVTDIENEWIETGAEPSSPVIHGFVVRCNGGERYRVQLHSECGWSAERLPDVSVQDRSRAPNRPRS